MVNRHTEGLPQTWPEFYNQHESFPWKSVGKRACGITSIAMSINQINAHADGFSKVTPLNVLRQANSLNKVPGDKTQLKLHVRFPDGNPEQILIGNALDESLRKDIEDDHAADPTTFILGSIPQESSYQPLYSVSRGWDHRGSEILYSRYGIEARQFGDKNGDHKNISDVVESLSSGSKLICSVKHSTDSTHVVLVAEYNQDDGTILVYDPLAHGAQWLNAAEWVSEFNGFGTILLGRKNK